MAHWTQVSDCCPLGYLFGYMHLNCLNYSILCLSVSVIQLMFVQKNIQSDHVQLLNNDNMVIR